VFSVSFQLIGINLNGTVHAVFVLKPLSLYAQFDLF
jgi:hypothetical protein